MITCQISVITLLEVCGKDVEILKFANGLKKYKDSYLLLESYIPCPQELSETIALSKTSDMILFSILIRGDI